jgi:hypothetical protein
LSSAQLTATIRLLPAETDGVDETSELLLAPV